MASRSTRLMNQFGSPVGGANSIENVNYRKWWGGQRTSRHDLMSQMNRFDIGSPSLPSSTSPSFGGPTGSIQRDQYKAWWGSQRTNRNDVMSQMNRFDINSSVPVLPPPVQPAFGAQVDFNAPISTFRPDKTRTNRRPGLQVTGDLPLSQPNYLPYERSHLGQPLPKRHVKALGREVPAVHAGGATNAGPAVGGSTATQRVAAGAGRFGPQIDKLEDLMGKGIKWGSGTNFGSRQFANGAGGKLTYGRAGLVGGLGLLAAANTFKTVERARYGDYGHAALNAGLATAAAGGAYAAYMHKGAFSNHFRNAASWLTKQMRRI